MANKRIDQLPVANQINDADLFVIEQSDTAKSVSGQKIKALVPTSLSQLSQDSTHRLVTDTEKSAWNGKQNAISDLETIRSNSENAVRYNEQSLTDEQQQQARYNIGLGSVDNTSDADKPVSAAQQTALNLKADKTALGRTDRSLEYLWKKSEGIIYDTETVHSNANTVTVPSGAMEYASMDMVGGKTLAFNQLVQNGNFVNNEHWNSTNASYSVENNICTMLASTQYANVFQNMSPVDGHKYLISCWIKTQTPNCNILFELGHENRAWAEGVTLSLEQMDLTSGQYVATLGAYSASEYGIGAPRLMVIDSRLSDFDSIQFSNVCLFDLTKMFGVGNEPATVEEFRAMFPDDYYAYNEGNLILTAVDKVISKKTDDTSIIEKSIPQSVIALCPDYGQGTVDSFNYIDFAEKKYHHKGSMDNDGIWTALASEEVVDLSAVIPEDFEILPVEAGGTIQFHYPEMDNGYSIGVPNGVTYMVDVAEVTA